MAAFSPDRHLLQCNHQPKTAESDRNRFHDRSTCKIGADGFALNAVAAVDRAKELLYSKRSIETGVRKDEVNE